MSKAWPLVKLGEVLVERQEAPDSITLDNGEIKVVSKISFKKGEIEFRNDSQTKTGMILIYPGDLVISGINAAKGAIAIYDEQQSNTAAATIHYGSYSVNRERADINFLWWLLRSNTFKEILNRNLPGGIKTELKAKRLLPIQIPLPPLAEQQRIVAKTERLAGKIEEAHKLSTKRIEEAELLWYAELRTFRNNLLDNPEYKKDKLGSITKVTAGGTPSRDISTYWNGQIPWIKTGELLDNDIHYAQEFITDIGVENSSAKIFPPNTVLIALYGQGQTRGRTGRLLIPAATNQACCAIFPNNLKFEPKYIQYWLRSLYLELRENAKGGAQPNWNSSIIKNIEIALPAIHKQRQIIIYLDKFQSKLESLKAIQAQTTAELDALLPSILDRAFKGEL